MNIVDVVQNYLNKPQLINCEFDNDLLEISIEQSFQPILYVVTGLKEYKKFYISWVVKQEQFKMVHSTISSLLNESEIPHFLSKKAFYAIFTMIQVF